MAHTEGVNNPDFFIINIPLVGTMLSVPELFMVPSDDNDLVCLCVGEVAGQVSAHPGPQQGGNPAHLRRLTRIG